MKKQPLLPYRFKKIGWLLFIPFAIAGIYLHITDYEQEWIKANEDQANEIKRVLMANNITGCADLFMRKDRAGLFFLVAAVLPPLLIALANPFVFTVERYAFMSLLFWMVNSISCISR